jgi:hypothetical protein
MKALELRDVVAQLADEHPEWAVQFSDVVSLLERDVRELAPVDAAHVLGLLAEVLERFDAMERAKLH